MESPQPTLHAPTNIAANLGLWCYNTQLTESMEGRYLSFGQFCSGSTPGDAFTEEASAAMKQKNAGQDTTVPHRGLWVGMTTQDAKLYRTSYRRGLNLISGLRADMLIPESKALCVVTEDRQIQGHDQLHFYTLVATEEGFVSAFPTNVLDVFFFAEYRNDGIGNKVQRERHLRAHLKRVLQLQPPTQLPDETSHGSQPLENPSTRTESSHTAGNTDAHPSELSDAGVSEDSGFVVRDVELIDQLQEIRKSDDYDESCIQVKLKPGALAPVVAASSSKAEQSVPENFDYRHTESPEKMPSSKSQGSTISSRVNDVEARVDTGKARSTVSRPSISREMKIRYESAQEEPKRKALSRRTEKETLKRSHEETDQELGGLDRVASAKLGPSSESERVRGKMDKLLAEIDARIGLMEDILYGGGK